MVKISELPPGKAIGADDVRRWSRRHNVLIERNWQFLWYLAVLIIRPRHWTGMIGMLKLHLDAVHWVLHSVPHELAPARTPQTRRRAWKKT